MTTPGRNQFSPPEFQIKRNKDHGGRITRGNSINRNNGRSKVSSPTMNTPVPLKISKQKSKAVRYQS